MTTSFQLDAFQQDAFQVDPTFADAVTAGGGGGYRNTNPLPQYYSRRVLDERVSLPQEPQSNAVAIAVLDDARELEFRLSKDDRDFGDMLETADHLLKQVAAYVESQQIYNIVRSIQAKVQARRDAEIAEQMAVVQEMGELDELMEGLLFPLHRPVIRTASTTDPDLDELMEIL